MKKLIFILLYLLGVGCAYAQNNNESSKFDSIVYLSPRAFNDWVWELRKKVIKKEISPQIIIDKTMERLKISLYVEEETLVQVANLWKYYLEKEAPTIDDVFAEKDKNSDVFKKTILIADSLITLLPKSDLRKWMLIRFKAGFLDLYDQGNEIEKDYLNNV